MNQLLHRILSKLENQRISNPKYLLLLAFFNCAILMDYQELFWHRRICFFIVFVMVFISFLHYKLWWTTLVICILNLYVSALYFPRMANHANFEFFITLVLLVLFFYKFIFPKFKMDAIFISYLFRISVITIYFYAGFNKLNSDFFNPCVSCVNKVNALTIKNLTGINYPIGSNFSTFLQFATIFIEMVLPFGLLSHKTRRFTAVLLFLFHFYLAFTVYADFSAFVGFLILGCLLDFKNEKIDRHLLLGYKCYAFFIMLALTIRPFFEIFRYDLATTTFVFGTVFNIGYLTFFLILLKNYKSKFDFFPKKQALQLFFVVMIISLWALKSYVGLGNCANLTMFSNLLTEKSRSNHLLIDTRKTKIFDFEEDNVLILELHDTLKKEKLEGFKLPLIEFKYNVKKWCKRYPELKINCILIYKKDTIVIKDLRKTKFAEAKWWCHYLYFRKIQVEGSNQCYW